MQAPATKGLFRQEARIIIRYSMLNAFLQCPAAFHRQYILGETETQKSSALEFGTALHLGIRSILEGEDGVSDFNLYWDSLKDANMVYYRHGWQELRDLANNKFLHNFAKSHAKKFINPVQEVELSMPFLGEHTLQGTLDCFSDYEGQPTITDWKTSTQEYKRTKIEKNPQLYIYAALHRHKYGCLPTNIQYKVFIKSDGRIQTVKKELTIEAIDCMMKNVENISKAMIATIGTKEYYHNHESCYCKEI